MNTRAIATIDVGTNTTLLLVARPRAGAAVAEAEILAESAEITRLGRGIGGDGRLGAEGIARTLAALERFATIARAHDAAITAIGTEALRRAPNADAFLGPAQEALGVPVQVIDGEREAALTFRAVAESFPAEIAAGRVLVVDIGGGSTELVLAERGQVSFRRSLPLGSVRLHERFIRHDPPTADETSAIEREVERVLDEASAAFAAGPVTALIGVAGTVTSLAAMALNLTSYDPAVVHGSRIGLATLDAQIARLGQSSQAERERIPGLDPRRADVIHAGALLLRAMARRAGVAEVRASDRGIRFGLYYELAAPATRTGRS